MTPKSTPEAVAEAKARYQVECCVQSRLTEDELASLMRAADEYAQAFLIAGLRRIKDDKKALAAARLADGRCPLHGNKWTADHVKRRGG